MGNANLMHATGHLQRINSGKRDRKKKDKRNSSRNKTEEINKGGFLPDGEDPSFPFGQDAHLAEKKLMLRIPLGHVSVRQAHTLF